MAFKIISGRVKNLMEKVQKKKLVISERNRSPLMPYLRHARGIFFLVYKCFSRLSLGRSETFFIIPTMIMDNRELAALFLHKVQNKLTVSQVAKSSNRLE